MTASAAAHRNLSFYYPRALHGDGGVTNSFWAWATCLERAGANVDVLFDPRLTPNPRRDLPDGGRLVPVAHVGRGRLAIARRLDGAVDPAGTLVLHSGYVAYNLAAAEWARRRDIPYVVVPHGAYDPHVRRRSHRRTRQAWEIAERRMLRNAVGVHVFFEPERQHLEPWAAGARTFVAPTPFPVPSVQWDADASLGYVAWLGRYDVAHKGLDRLLDALALLPPGERPDVRLHGRDHHESRAAVQHMVATRGLVDSVRVGGPIEGVDKERFLLGAAAYAHPARWESYGIALVECLALGVPCLTTLSVNLGEILRAADAAAVTGTTVADLAAGLRTVANGGMARYGGRGRAFVRTHLGEDAAAGRFLAACEAARAVAR